MLRAPSYFIAQCHADCYPIASTLACWGRTLRWRDWPPRRSVRAQWEAVRCGHECRPGHEWSPSSCASQHTQVGCVRDRRDRALVGEPLRPPTAGRESRPTESRGGGACGGRVRGLLVGALDGALGASVPASGKISGRRMTRRKMEEGVLFGGQCFPCSVRAPLPYNTTFRDDSL